MFVLDRIKMLNVTDRTFEVPGDFDLETYMRSPFRVIHDRPVKVTVRFDKKVAGYVKEKIWHHTQRIEPQKDGSIIFSAEVAGTTNPWQSVCFAERNPCPNPGFMPPWYTGAQGSQGRPLRSQIWRVFSKLSPMKFLARKAVER